MRRPRLIGALRELALATIAGSLLAVSLAPVHHGYRRLAHELALVGFEHASPDRARAYLADIAGDATEGASTDRDRAEALARWVRDEVPIAGRANHPHPVVGIERGGVCGQLSRVLVELARADGLEARQVMLNWNGTGAPHVIAEIRTDDGWVACDPLGFSGLGSRDETFVACASSDGAPASVPDLYEHPEALPDGNSYGPAFFRAGRTFKVEVQDDLRATRTTPGWLHGRDWPEVSVPAGPTAPWPHRADEPAFQVVTWHQLPYLSRIVCWIGGRPFVMHFEWPLFALAAAAWAPWRLRARLSPTWQRRATWLTLAGLAVYLVTITALWWHRLAG